MKIGMLTSGGDCQGLNAALRGIAKTLRHLEPTATFYGIFDGYKGLIEGDWREMRMEEFSGILTTGGTILRTSRQPFKGMQVHEADEPDKLTRMLANYKAGGFDALIILGGNGTHKTAHLLSQNGANVVTLPKTIDNDVYGTDMTFGFDSAVGKATEVIDAIHTTAASHGRVFVVEIMGHKVGWIALHAGVAGGADVILLPEIPYDIDIVAKAIQARNRANKHFSIVVAAEGALSKQESALPKKERKAVQEGPVSAGVRIAGALTEQLGQDVRATVPGHFQRGGQPTPGDRLLCSRLGAMAAELVVHKKFGHMAALKGGKIVAVPLDEVAGKLKMIKEDNDIVRGARLLGVSFGDIVN